MTIVPMTQEECMHGGASLRIRYEFASTPFGRMLIASTHRGICHLSFVTNTKQSLQALKKRFPPAHYQHAKTKSHARAIRAVQSPSKKSPSFSLHLYGTPFQQKVWAALRLIPPGTQTTYTKIAKTIKHPKALRAVGTAVGRNPIAVLIPCHRVIPSSGGIGQYHWGAKRKAALIHAEKNLP